VKGVSKRSFAIIQLAPPNTRRNQYETTCDYTVELPPIQDRFKGMDARMQSIAPSTRRVKGRYS
jgi:hypothetical protein